MQRKEDILDNVDQYAAEDLVRFVRSGVVTYEELVGETDGRFSAKQRKAVKALLENGDADAWENAKAVRTVEAVRNYLDGYPDGKFREEARDLLDEIRDEAAIEEEVSREAADWQSVDRDSPAALAEYIDKNPRGKYVKEARKLLNSLLAKIKTSRDIGDLVREIKRIYVRKDLNNNQKDANVFREIDRFISDGAITTSDFISALSGDPNLVTANVIRQLLDEGVLSRLDLSNINDKVVDSIINKMLTPNLQKSHTASSPFDRIHKQSTEIYFWGIPSSGKSCALGAILNVAHSGRVATMVADNDSQGYRYMNYLIDQFEADGEDDVVTLLKGTNVDEFYEMGFDLVDGRYHVHPITCIDMAGELMRCMYKKNARMPLSELEERMLDTMHKVLIDNRSSNRKMHFFVVEYGGEERKYEDIPQYTYLEGAIAYIKNTGILKKETDAVFIMITKVDKAKDQNSAALFDYLKKKYGGVYGNLDGICKENRINGGKVEIVYFSLGKVYFQNYCHFIPKAAENVVRIILERSAGYRAGRRGKIGRIFKR